MAEREWCLPHFVGSSARGLLRKRQISNTPNSIHIFLISFSYSNFCSITLKMFENFILADPISIEYSIGVILFSIEYLIKISDQIFLELLDKNYCNRVSEK